MKKILLVCCLFLGITTAVNAQSKVVTDPAEKAKGLQKQLKLSEDQTRKVASIYKESAQKFDKIKADEHGNTNKMLTSVTKLRKETVVKIKAVLKPAQAVKYENLVKQNSKTGGSGWSDGWSPSSGS